MKRFERKADEIAAFLKDRFTKKTRVEILTHADADGISAASILAHCFYTYDIAFRVRFTRPFGAKDVIRLGELEKDKDKLFVFIDQGSKEVTTIHRYLLGAGYEAIILDHHQGEFLEHPSLAHFNPHLLGFNGSKEVSASGVVYSVVEQIDKRFRHLVWLALVGAIGDRQELFSGFSGINEVLVRRAVDLGFLDVNEGIKLIGRETMSVLECLRLSIKPYLPSISGDPLACDSLLASVSASPSSTLNGLGIEKEKMLRDALFARLSRATSEELSYMLWGPIYSLKAEHGNLLNVQEWAVMLEACGASGRPELGFAAVTGDKVARDESLALLRGYQEQVIKAVGWLVQHINSFKVTSNARYIYSGREVRPTLIGEVLSLAFESGLVATDRPLVGFADVNEHEVKASGRATFGLVMRGVNIGRAMAQAAEAVDGEGGGHDVSGAAYIPRERIDDFISKVEQNLTFS